MNILGINISNVSYDDMLRFISENLSSSQKFLITYVNVNSLNLAYKNPELQSLYTNFDIRHPDGIGVHLASKILYPSTPLKQRMTGSDFYILLKNFINEKNLKLFLFGDTNETLNKVLRESSEINNLRVSSGYNFDNNTLINSINDFSPDILIVGLGAPFQEKWAFENYEKLNFKFLICVGEGIKVFSGTKIRGPLFIRKIGLEWFVRFLSKPFRYFKRYIIGNPLFIIRILKQKFNGV